MVKRRLTTHCVNGHRRTKRATYLDTRGKRQCRICRTLAARRWYKNNAFRVLGHKPRPSPEERALMQDRAFFSRVTKSRGGCWIWKGKPDVYGGFCGERAYRWSYKRFVGPIPEGLSLDHLCFVPGCVNPHHLDPVEMVENIRRSHRAGRHKHLYEHLGKFHAAKTHCPSGHPYSGSNLLVEKRADGGFARRCAICSERRFEKYQRKVKRQRCQK